VSASHHGHFFPYQFAVLLNRRTARALVGASAL
jgi:hypothetical protein